MTIIKRLLNTAGCACTALLLANCTMSTPQARIEANHSLYESLSENDQELVSQGRIAKGMSKSAVFLALGDPSRKSEGFREGAPFERWDYTRLQPRYYNSFHSYYGYGHGYGYGYGHCDYPYHGFGWSPSVEYVPYRAASVLFRRGVVESWERLEPGLY